MKHSIKYQEGYRYFVYEPPGNIAYFYELWLAEEYADEVGAKVQEVF